MDTIYPTIEEADTLHSELIRRFGGPPGIRDLGLLESCLFRPRSGYYETLSEQAAALMQSLAFNHPFVDGNKRMAFALTAVFLRINGYMLSVPPSQGEGFIVNRLTVGHAELAEIAEWVEVHIRRI